jgi:hypothetical protein
MPGDQLTFIPSAQHQIKLSSKEPVYIHQYRTTYCLQNVVAEQVEELLREGLVQPINNPYKFPLLLQVPMKL